MPRQQRSQGTGGEHLHRELSEEDSGMCLKGGGGTLKSHNFLSPTQQFENPTGGNGGGGAGKAQTSHKFLSRQSLSHMAFYHNTVRKLLEFF